MSIVLFAVIAILMVGISAGLINLGLALIITAILWMVFDQMQTVLMRVNAKTARKVRHL